MSEFNKYANNTRIHIDELQNAISKEERQWLRQYLIDEGLTAVYKWLASNHKEVDMYLQATESERRKKKKWNVMPDKVFLIYTSLLAAYLAEDYLQVASAQESRMYCGMSYREMTAQLGMDLYESGMNRVDLWPFEDDPNPPKIKMEIIFSD